MRSIGYEVCLAGERKVKIETSLDWLNFSLADVRGGLGPYLGIFLLTQQHWSQATIGLIMTVSGMIGLAIQTPVGAFIDATRFKRGAIVAGAAMLAISAMAIWAAPTFPVVLTANTMMAVGGAVFGPGVAAVTLGLLGQNGLSARMGRNGAFDHAGNVFIACLAGVVGWWLSQRAVFYLVPIFALIVAATALSIPGDAIDHDRARGLDHSRLTGGHTPSGWRVLIECRPLLIFAGSIALFHFANAPMLPLVGQKLALAHEGQETILMSSCIVAAQLVMLPMAILVGAKADTWGWKPILLAAFAILPIRGALYPLSDDRLWLVAVQLLDGIGAGILGVMTPLVLVDLMRDTGRYNVSAGLVATIQGIGASLSNTVAGFIVVKAGYSAAFLVLAGVALIAFLWLLLAFSETHSIASLYAADPRTRLELHPD
jgi:MFS family permease